MLRLDDGSGYHWNPVLPQLDHNPFRNVRNTSLILGIGVALMFLPSAFLHKNATFEEWFLLSIMLISCPGFFLILFMLSYLVNVGWYKNDPRRHQKRE